MNLIFLLFLFYTNISTIFARCRIPSTTKKSPIGCNLDLTVAIDMSASMDSVTNIVKLSNNILSFLSTIDYHQNAYVAGLTFGASTIDASRYFNNYEEICDFIHSAQEQSIQMGMASANLSEVFRVYEVSLLQTKRIQNQKILLIFTAIENDDKDSIAAAKYYSKKLKAVGVEIIVIAFRFLSSQ
uniref:VWFA domain-containing protein n=1 Tax=Panagrolaimus superbus TaxID=310955 RepID=A0A914XUH2_9BILA